MLATLLIFMPAQPRLAWCSDSARGHCPCCSAPHLTGVAVWADTGKSTLIQELARLTNNNDLIRVHLDDQMDAKSLLGAYVTTAVPGEFAWQPGPVAQVCSCSSWAPAG